jgi:adenine-specific DNA methylase
VALAKSRSTTPAETIAKKKKLQYSEIKKKKNEELHELTLKPKQQQTTEEIKQLLKTHIDPVNIQVAIRSLKCLRNGNVLIEADTKEEIEILNSQIRESQ